MDEVVNLTAVDSNGVESQVQIEIRDVYPFALRIVYPIELESEYQEDDLFSSLLEARLFLEGVDMLLCCQGARPDVFPSGQQKQMTGGRAAYVLQNDSSDSTVIEVDIFAPAERAQVGTVEAQRAAVMRFYGFG